jgi:DNA-binding response OmpR family regulator
MRLLVVEDEPELAQLLHGALLRAGFAVDRAGDIAAADDHLRMVQYDALVLDLGLPDGDGLALLRSLRRAGTSTPVLILTARDAPDDRVTGLDTGADDYLVKPFHMPELIARIRALLRRPNAALGRRLQAGNLSLDTITRSIMVDVAPLLLSAREAGLLELLLRRQGGVVTREIIEASLYGFDTALGSNAVEVLVHRLRRKLQESGATAYVHTLRGVGYLLAETA